MMSIKRPTWEVVILFVATTLVLVAFYGEFIFSPNAFIFNNDGDGIKNYYTFLYHLRHEESIVWFSGMNYPFGDLHFFADGNHPLSLFLRPFSDTFLVRGNEVALFNLYFLLSIYPCVFLLFFILKRFGVRPVIAIFGALIISFFSPQWFRLSGHYALSLFYAIPLSLFFLQWLLRGTKRKWLFLGLVVFFFTLFLFTHAYLGLMAIGVFGVSGIFYLLLSKGVSSKMQKWIFIGIGSILPILIIQLYITIFNPFHDRPSNFLGLMDYTSNPESVFLPNAGFINKHTQEYFPYGNQSWEGFGYIGIATEILLAVLFIGLLLNFIGLKFARGWTRQIPLLLRCWLAAGILFLLLSFGTFHELLGEEFRSILGPLKQIRGLGRFVWIFYFASLIVAFYLLDLLLRKVKGSIVKISVAVFFIGLYSVETIALQLVQSGGVGRPNDFEGEHVQSEKMLALHTAAAELNPGDFQCLLPVPFYHIGAEYYIINDSGELYKESQVLSYWLGLPILSNATGRTSLSRSKMVMQLVTPPFVAKSIPQKGFDHRDILIVVDKEVEIHSYEQWLIAESNILKENEYFELRALSVETLLTPQRKEIPVSIEQCLQNSQLCVSDSSKFIFSETFDGETCRYSCFSPDGSYMIGSEYGTPVTLESNRLKSGGSYFVSLWVYSAFLEKRGFFVIQEERPNGEIVGWTDGANMINTPFIWNDWSMVEMPLKVEDGGNVFKMVTVESRQKTPLVIDNFLIRDKEVDVYQNFNDSVYLLNNKPVNK